MKNKKLFYAVMGGVVLTFLVILTVLASAPTCDSDFESCVFVNGFDSALEGWSVDSPGTVEWLSKKDWFDVGFGGTGSQIFYATGVLHAGSSPKRIYKSVLVSPGEYLIKVRVSSDANAWGVNTATEFFTLSYVDSANHETIVSDPTPFYSQGQPYEVELGSSYSDLQSLPFIITQTKTIQVAMVYRAYSLFSHDDAFNVYVDQIVLGRLNAPISGGATYTPQPTAIPQSTPQPASAPSTYCIAPPRFDEFNAISTDAAWGYLNTSGLVYSPTVGISRTTNAVIQTSNVNYTNSAAGAVALPFSTGTLPTRPAYVYTRQFSNPSHLILKARAESVPSGTTANLLVYARDITGTWSLVTTRAQDAGHWREELITFTLPISNITAIGLTAARSDNPSSGYIYLDDIYVYGDELMAPRCDGTYPPGVTSVTGTGVEITVPFDKPCPAPIYAPNNFFGMILSGLTLFLDWATASFPVHTVLGVKDTVLSFVNSPIWIFTDLAGRLWDLRPLLTVISAIILLEGVRWTVMAWQYIKQTVPFLGG